MMGTWLTEVMVLSAVVIFAGVLCVLPTILRESKGNSEKNYLQGRRRVSVGRLIDADLANADFRNAK